MYFLPFESFTKQVLKRAKKRRGFFPPYIAHCQLALTLEFYNTADFGKKGIIASLANVETGVKFGSPLPDKYIARLYSLSAVHFYAKPF
jgi:hypothetical protein